MRYSALCVIAGIGLAVLVTRRRNRKDGGRPGLVLDVAAWAVPFGLAGVFLHALLLDAWHHSGAQSTLLHTAAEAVAAIGVPGAMVLGAAGAWIACHRAGVPLDPVAKAAAPGVAFGLAVGALGRWWTQNFYGHPASWLLAVRILPVHRVPGYENFATFQPAFLYQSAWDLAMGLALIWAVRRFALTGARTFMLAAAGYGLGGLWMESVRIGPQLRVFGMLFDVWADLVVIVVATVLFVLTRPRQRPPYKVPLAGARRVM